MCLPIWISALDGCEWSASRHCLFSSGKDPRYPLDRRLGGPQSRSGLCGEEWNFLPLPGIDPWPSSPLLYRLSYTDSYANNTLSYSKFFTDKTKTKFLFLLNSGFKGRRLFQHGAFLLITAVTSHDG
jgi:hypothetical protein